MSDSTDAMLVAVKLVKEFEGFYSKPYLCPAGVPTIGYGSIYYQDGRRVTLDDPEITEEQAKIMMMGELKGCMAAAIKASPSLAEKPQELGAIADFIYNLGAGRYRASTLRKRIDAGDWDGAKVQIMRWVRANGRVLRGLVRRRAAEAAYFG
jgi:lysozyme